MVQGFKREGAEGGGFLRKKEYLEAKTEDPFNATEQESPPVDIIKKRTQNPHQMKFGQRVQARGSRG
ncbi:TPA: hypothetical protein CPT80_06925 [Candidatus Gastranaerophilales bacterium HUM_9]|nr:MAG TPA: hypothetical protein CPT80_06925 [Candidatus Gastranaerophilales bacterium HUM_9]HBX35273.1 hypothetical protein [Cyanobacteria bacterium UBA11440]